MQDQNDRTSRQGQPGKDVSAENQQTPNEGVIEAFVAQLNEQEQMLILLQSELYEGSWQAMMADLQNRLEGRPFIFKLANRIRDDMARIEKLQAFEEEHGVKLADCVKPPLHPNVDQ